MHTSSMHISSMVLLLFASHFSCPELICPEKHLIYVLISVFLVP